MASLEDSIGVLTTPMGRGLGVRANPRPFRRALIMEDRSGERSGHG